MKNQFALDLTVARRKSGLTQADCAHLLGTSRSRVSQLESGKAVSSIRDICTLSLIYGRPFESLFGAVMERVTREIRDRLSNLPVAPKNWLGRFKRNNTLGRLAARLAADDHTGHGAA
ncbi:MAG: helix-turn-helix transcriptional regulator [Nitratireductor sp.]|uniref:helix-turn-helix transcriptional regulator n=1 Tax=Alphaproteobacteria TaxID=28211 RepID=UPI00327EF761